MERSGWPSESKRTHGREGGEVAGLGARPVTHNLAAE